MIFLPLSTLKQFYLYLKILFAVAHIFRIFLFYYLIKLIILLLSKKTFLEFYIIQKVEIVLLVFFNENKYKDSHECQFLIERPKKRLKGKRMDVMQKLYFSFTLNQRNFNTIA